MNAQDIIDTCLAHGFASAGITNATLSTYKSALESWLAEGQNGEMEWMNRNVHTRLDPRELLNGAKSVIAVADRYGQFKEPELPAGHGKIARYARGKDYHKVMKKRLHQVCDVLREQFPDEIFRACVDTAPILEREIASRAGLGAIGKHTLLIEQGIGSWMLLGAIVTTAQLTTIEKPEQDPCATCTQCIDACPTDAITPWHVDARRCISYLTIEHRTCIDPEFYSGIGEWLFGCDICQEVCPHNQPTERAVLTDSNEAYNPKMNSLSVIDVLGWNEDDRRIAFQGSSMKRAKLGMMRRNAVIVAGNILATSSHEQLRNMLLQIAHDDSDVMVQETARIVIQNLEGT